ncbi:MAG: alpha/beta fold hydrolase [Pseudolysinimonas sp.]
MQQRIDRVTSSDGASITLASIGEGRPILYVAGWLGHLEEGWRLPPERAFYEALGRGARLVRYDRSGTGMSPSTGRAPSLVSELDALSAVAGSLGSESFDLVGVSLGAPIAAAWAGRHPEAVRRLVLYGGWASGPRLSPPTARDHILALVKAHWGLGSDLLTDVFAPDADPATRAQIAQYQRASSDPATAAALLALSYELDVTADLASVRAPTLGLHREHARAAPEAQAHALATGIEGARLEMLPGRSHLPWAGDAHEVVAAMRRFLGLRAGRRDSGALTARQEEVAALIGEGRTNREIAALLGIEERSAEGHVERIRQRLGVRSRAQIAAWWVARN